LDLSSIEKRWDLAGVTPQHAKWPNTVRHMDQCSPQGDGALALHLNDFVKTVVEVIIDGVRYVTRTITII
jgi:hypothetical protein